MQQSRFRKLLASVLAGPIILLLVLAATFLVLIRWMNAEAAWVDHTDQVIAAAERTQGLLIDMETGARGYLLTDNKAFLAPYERASEEIHRSFIELKNLVSDNPRQYNRAEELRRLFEEWSGMTARMIQRETVTVAPQVSGRQRMDNLRIGFSQFIAVENELRVTRRQRVAGVTRTVIGTSVTAAILLGILVGYLTRRAVITVAGEYAETLRESENERARAQRLAAENERAYREVEAASRAKDDFLATLSHELRTPLTSVLGWAKLLLMQDHDRETTRQAIEAIERGAQAQATLIEDILDVSRAITGKLRLELQDVDASAVIEHALAAIRPAADAKHIAISTAVDENMPMSADPNRLQQIIWNLLSNAVKFSPPDSRIDVNAKWSGDQVIISVRDEGRGIDAAFLPYVFDRFRQADATSTRDTGGLGIGLSVVKLLTELHGGSVRAESAGAGKGATFTVVLPAQRRREAQKVASGVDPSRSARPLADNDVLLVDDDNDARSVIASMLAMYGARLVAASSVGDAMRILASRKFSVVLSDIAMPGASGFDLVAQLRAVDGPNRNTPVIAITALTESAARGDKNSQFAATLQKPVDPAQLASAVAAVVGQQPMV